MHRCKELRLITTWYFNLGKGDGTSLNEFISIVEKHTGKKAVIRQLPDQPGDVPYTCASVEKARILLGYEATVPFDEGIRRTVQWYKASQGKPAEENSMTIPSSLVGVSPQSAVILSK